MRSIISSWHFLQLYFPSHLVTVLYHPEPLPSLFLTSAFFSFNHLVLGSIFIHFLLSKVFLQITIRCCHIAVSDHFQNALSEYWPVHWSLPQSQSLPPGTTLYHFIQRTSEWVKYTRARTHNFVVQYGKNNRLTKQKREDRERNISFITEERGLFN